MNTACKLTLSGTLNGSYEDDAALAVDDLVFLPAAGCRLGSDVRVFGVLGYYWSSTPSNDGFAYYLSLLTSDRRYQVSRFGREEAFAVRLVTNVK